VTAFEDRHITIFLLLDELNANAAAPLVDALAKAGRKVRVKSLAKPCGMDAVCSGGRVLDFSRGRSASL